MKSLECEDSSETYKGEIFREFCKWIATCEMFLQKKNYTACLQNISVIIFGGDRNVFCFYFEGEIAKFFVTVCLIIVMGTVLGNCSVLSESMAGK